MPELLKLPLQFFAKKKVEEFDMEDIEEDDEEEEETSPPKKKKPAKKGEDTPPWAKEILDLLTPKEASKKETEIPVPPAPKVKEEEDDHEEAPTEMLGKKILRWLW
jgi:hypothetical protein